ncbi:hypothetical protein [Pelomonas sp. Root1237]|jgi:hypothetical protein|uniref:hypothetical protein n=1 Tax=Pelomonas sp. Root1237 TaxID=1736434 RepID=UPI0006FF49A9|nr:hypothetical protein [Pelomonas sp. Root1237]KQV94103.1 hypothetical protein ASC91_28070 [Pelomonas sp. Root1237]
MPTLAEFQTRMNGDDPADALAAATALANYYSVYNDEYNALITKKTEAEMAIAAESTNPAGVDHAEILNLQGLVLGIQSRKKVQDAKMLAFQASTLAINPPTAALIQQVKAISTRVAAMVARDQGIQSLMVALGQLAGLVNQIQGN